MSQDFLSTNTSKWRQWNIFTTYFFKYEYFKSRYNNRISADDVKYARMKQVKFDSLKNLNQFKFFKGYHPEIFFDSSLKT